MLGKFQIQALKLRVTASADTVNKSWLCDAYIVLLLWQSVLQAVILDV